MSKFKVVYARASTTARAPGSKYSTQIAAGSIWYAGDPLVLANPGLFSTEPTKIHGTPPDAPVEQASAAPGEKRSTRRAD